MPLRLTAFLITPCCHAAPRHICHMMPLFADIFDAMPYDAIFIDTLFPPHYFRYAIMFATLLLIRHCFSI